MFHKFINFIHKLSRYFERNTFRKECWRHDAWLLEKWTLPQLTQEEYSRFCNIWSCFNINPKDLAYVRMYKLIYGFDPYFMPDYEFYQYIIPKTNPIKLVSAFKNKALYDVYFSQMPIIQCITRTVGGGKFDSCMHPITDDQELVLLLKQNQFIIKPAFDTGCGKGVKKICLSKIEDKRAFLTNLLHSYNGDYITQEVLVQHPDIAKLNPRSLNCCRVTSIYLNNRFSCSTILKVGKLNSDVDNWHDSYMIGVDKKGKLLKYGYDSDLNMVERTDNGILFEGIQLPMFKEMIEIVEKYHKYYFSNIGILGWDICVDVNNQVRMVEVNVDYPGIAGEQMASGTFFKERREDLIKILS